MLEATLIINGYKEFVIRHFDMLEEMSNYFICQCSFIADQIGVLKIEDSVDIKINNLELERKIIGIVTEYSYTYVDYDKFLMQITVAPKLFLLDINAKYKIYQNKNASTIVQSILADYSGINMTNMAVMSGRANREYCVQYEETDFAFIQRLFLEEGMFYICSTDGKLIVGDSNAIYKKHNGFDYHGRKVTNLDITTGAFSVEYKESIGIGGAKIFNFNSKKPLTHLESDKKDKMDYIEEKRIESYEDPSKQIANQYYDQNKDYPYFKINTNIVTIGVGDKFLIKINNTQIEDLVAYKIEHFIEYINNKISYRNTIYAIKSTNSYKKINNIKDRKKTYVDTAIVVGSHSEHAHYSSNCMVKVKFHWDKRIATGHDTTCWIPVSQSMTGKSFGAYILPHVDQEVVVNFVNGNLDYPIIIGCVYNGDNKAPYKEEKIIGITTSKDDGGDDNVQEIKISDMKGKEEIFVNAKKDLTVKVKKDYVTEIKKGDYKLELEKGHYHIRLAKGDFGLLVEEATATIMTGDDCTFLVSGNMNIGVTKDLKIDALENIVIDCKNFTVNASDNLRFNVKGNTNINTDKMMTLKAEDGKLNMKNATVTSEVFNINGDHTTINAEDATINGQGVSIQSVEKVTVTSASGDVTILAGLNCDIGVIGALHVEATTANINTTATTMITASTNIALNATADFAVQAPLIRLG